MNAESRKRLDMARRLADAYRALVPVRAGAVAGSVAQDQADAISDIDLLLYFEALPTQEQVTAVRDLLGGSDWIFYFGDPVEGGVVTSCYIQGIKHDIAHMTIAAWERDMVVVLEQHTVDTPLQKAVAGMLDLIPLFGEDLLEGWRARCADYPAPLAEAMVRAHLRFTPLWVPRQMALDRGDLLWVYEIFVRTEQSILGVLLGLNRIYHWGEYKRMDAFLAQMKIAPPKLASRLKSVLRNEPGKALQELDTLIEETFALAERHMPQIDVAALRERYRRPLGV